MRCVACGRDGAYNRAVVDTVSDRELGLLCPECERAEFGRSLDRGDWSGESCCLCERDGFYALPRWRASVVEVDGRQVARTEYSLDAPCPRLCDVHFQAVAGETDRELAGATSPHN